jgi:curli biogenesis system outer membrane secretion channel CsgG
MRRLLLVFLLGVPSAAQALFGDPYARAAKELTSNLGELQGAKAAVVPLRYAGGNASSGGAVVAAALESELVKGGRLKLVERSQMDKLLTELKLQQTGMVSAESALKVGKMSGAQLLITGTLVPTSRSRVEVNVKLIRVETGDVLKAARVHVKKTWKDVGPAKIAVTKGVPPGPGSLTVTLATPKLSGAVRKVGSRDLAFRYADQGRRPVIRVTDFTDRDKPEWTEVAIRYNPRSNTYKQFKRDFSLAGRKYRMWSDLQSNLHIVPRVGLFGWKTETRFATVLPLQPVFETWIKAIEKGMKELRRYAGPPQTKVLAYFEPLERKMRVSIFTAAKEGADFVLDYEPRDVEVLRGVSGRRVQSRLMTDGAGYYRFHYSVDARDVTVERVR